METEQLSGPVKNESTPDWLDKLQNESWQAEILISGGAFVALLNSYDAVDIFFNYLRYSTNVDYALLVLDNFFTWSITFLLAGFLTHLIIRGYWIGLIGLNYVFPKGINQSRLSFTGKFKKVLTESSNTSLLISIDKLCGVIFAIVFLFMASIVGLSLYFTLILIAVDLVGGPIRPFLAIIIVLLMVIGIITLVDFITLGRLKRISWFSKIYFPIYSFTSIITLSFLYRRLYYTLVSNIKAKYIYLLFILQITLIGSSDIFSNASELKTSFSNKKAGFHYLQNKEFLSLKSEICEGTTLDFALIHMARLERPAFQKWKKLHPEENKIKSLDMMDPTEQLKLVTDIYSIYIDDIIVPKIQWLYTNETAFGLSTNHLIASLDVSQLPPGRHQLGVKINIAQSDLPVFLLLSGYYAKIGFLVKRTQEKLNQ